MSSVILEDVVDKIIDYRGKTPKKLGTDWRPSGIPAISAKNIKNGSIVRQDTIRYVDEATYSKWMKEKVIVGDILMTSEAPLGETVYVKDEHPFVLSQRLFAMRTKPDKLDSRYFYMLTKTPNFQKLLQTFGTGATVSGIRQALLWKLPLEITDIKSQKKIADIAWNYDALIENNTKRIEKLETMARLLYKTKFENHTAAGNSVPFLDCIDINPKVKVPKDGLNPYIPMGNLRQNSMIIESVGWRSGNSGSKFAVGDTLFARITPSLENGKTSFVFDLPNDEQVGFGSTEFIVMRSRKLSPELVYLVARSNIVRDTAIKSMTGASGRQRVQDKCFEKISLPKLSDTTIKELTDKLRPIFRQVHVLHKKNRKLAQARDLLLPRLMSGEIKV